MPSGQTVSHRGTVTAETSALDQKSLVSCWSSPTFKSWSSLSNLIRHNSPYRTEHREIERPIMLPSFDTIRLALILDLIPPSAKTALTWFAVSCRTSEKRKNHYAAPSHIICLSTYPTWWACRGGSLNGAACCSPIVDLLSE